MDKCTQPTESDSKAAPTFNALDIMKEGAAAKTGAKAEGGAVSDEELKASRSAVGDAWLDEKGNLVLHMRRTSQGMPVESLRTFHPGTKNYEDTWKHIGGLKPGETKLVQPWPD